MPIKTLGNKKKIVIALDVDDVICDTIGFAKEAVEQAGLKWIWPEDWHCSNMSEEARKVTIDAFLSMEIFNTKCCHPFIPKAINTLINSDDKSVWFITARQTFDDALEKTCAQLKNYGINASTDMIIIANDKHQALVDIHADFLFDDNPNNIEIANQIPGLTAVMISNNCTTYNYHMRGKIPHYGDLVEALKAFNLCE